MKKALLLIGLFFGSLWTRAAGAVPVVEDKEKGIAINVGVLLQPTFQVTGSGAFGGHGACGTERPNCSTGIGNARGDGPAFDLFLRRARLMLWGNVTKEISFFVDTDEPNLGKGGNFTTTTFIQDAFLTYSFDPAFRIDAGLMLVPLSHHTLEGATSLNALDYHSDMIRFPAGRIFRDVGVQFRGLLAGDHLHYRLGVFEGVRNGAVAAAPMGAPARTIVNPGSVPRVTGQLRGNILGKEPDFFFKGIYFATEPIVSVGVGADFQPNSVIKTNNTYAHYFAASGDVYVDYPFSADMELIVKANYFYWAPGTTNLSSAAAFANTSPGASSLYGEVGFRYKAVEPIVFAEDLMGKNHALDILAVHGGVNVWVMKHNFNIKTDMGWRQTSYELPRPPENAHRTQKDLIFTTQAQVFF